MVVGGLSHCLRARRPQCTRELRHARAQGRKNARAGRRACWWIARARQAGGGAGHLAVEGG